MEELYLGKRSILCGIFYLFLNHTNLVGYSGALLIILVKFVA